MAAWATLRCPPCSLSKVLPQPLALQSDVTYAIAGGLGGLGGIIAEWMAQQGVRHIALIGRNADPGSDRVRALEQTGIQVLAIQADVSQSADVVRVLNKIEATMPPLRGIIHSAGVLDDGLLLQQDWARFERVLAPKVEGAWNLHSLTQTHSVDFFVCFSSTASLFGSPGQGSYAAANAFLDALAHYRQAHGLPSLTINWGLWDTVGMAATVNARSRQRWTDRGH
ncbi:MAG: SDR family oxidoreductase [Chloroflexota bacterium]|nr:SDR family oxidoreductase [Chloroflexota bacterium]